MVSEEIDTMKSYYDIHDKIHDQCLKREKEAFVGLKMIWNE